MRLRFGQKEWLHVLMAVQVAQKVLTDKSNALYTSAWDTSAGRYVGEELHRLVSRSPNAPQIATKLDFSKVVDMLPDRFEIGEPRAPGASNATERRLAALEASVKDLYALSAANTDAPQTSSRLNWLEKQVSDVTDNVLRLMQPKCEEGYGAAFTEHKGHVHQRFLKVFDFIARVEDRLLALERRRK